MTASQTARCFGWLAVMGLCVILAVAHGDQLAAEELAEPDADLGRLVQELDADNFATRQQASRKLFEAGAPAIQPLAMGARGRSLEVTERAILVLRKLSLSADDGLAEAARESLAGLATAKVPAIALRARQALLARQERALAMLARLQARFETENEQVAIIYFDGTTVTDDDLKLLVHFPDLRFLSLGGTGIGDAGLANLKGLAKLAWLNLYRTQIGDEGLKFLRELPSLRHVPMGETHVTDAGLVHLKDLRELEYLGLRGNEVTDAGLMHLQKLTSLTGLHLGETRVTDAGLAHLRKLQSLNSLRLHSVRVSDAGLEHLASLKELKRVELWETQVSAQGVERLKTALPELEVVLTGSR